MAEEAQVEQLMRFQALDLRGGPYSHGKLLLLSSPAFANSASFTFFSSSSKEEISNAMSGRTFRKLCDSDKVKEKVKDPGKAGAIKHRSILAM